AGPNGSVFVARVAKKDQGLWEFTEVSFAGSSDGRLDHYVHGFGQDPSGEVYVLVTDASGPSGTTGAIYKLIPAKSSGGTPALVTASTENDGGVQNAEAVSAAPSLQVSASRGREQVRLDLPDAADVRLDVYDVAGRFVRQIVNGRLAA